MNVLREALFLILAVASAVLLLPFVCLVVAAVYWMEIGCNDPDCPHSHVGDVNA